ncbi:MAG: Flp pilus assembly protein CpaB [Methylovirgula sp.]
MKPARIVILAAAIVAGLGAAVLVAGSKSQRPMRQAAIVRVGIPMDKVLVAAKQITGEVQEGDLRWQPWPKNAVPPGVIREAAMPNAIAHFKGFCIRDKIGPGEPLTANILIPSPPGQGCSMAATLPPGMRAVAINIDQQGATTAGGFIRPGDRVDVIHTFKDPSDLFASKASGGVASATLLRNVKVLAIGSNNERQGDKRAVGSNATLELTPPQVEKIVLAQRVGQLYLSLRSIADASTTESADTALSKPPDDTNMTIVRFGVPAIVPFSVPVQTQAY